MVEPPPARVQVAAENYTWELFLDGVSQRVDTSVVFKLLNSRNKTNKKNILLNFTPYHH